MAKIKMVKPSGVKVEINDHPDNIAKAKELGWKKQPGRKAEAE